MSNAQMSDATLRGYSGPFFPDYIRKLQEAFYGKRSFSFNGSNLDIFGLGVPGFVGTKRLKTTGDGYCWFWSMHFKTRTGKVIILFPWGQDFEGSDGTSADRHIALHTDGECTDADIRTIVAQIISARDTWARETFELANKV